MIAMPPSRPLDTASAPVPASGPSKIIFVNQLRGLCVVAVMLVHYTVVMQYMRGDVATVIGAPPLDTPFAPIALWLYPPWLDLGKLGVGVFFLISGFVIPLSLERSGIGSFLVSRWLRIVPTFWVGLLVGAASIALSSHLWHRPHAFHLHDYVLTALFLQAAVNSPIVDWVSWTLSIEVKFYLVAALLRPVILAGRTLPLIGLAMAGLLLNVLQGHALVHLPPQLVDEAMYLGYICIGTMFFYRYRGATSLRTLFVAVSCLATVFFASYEQGPMAGAFWLLHTGSFGLAVMVFALCFRFRHRFRRSRGLDGLAAISYPLYLIHAQFGFVGMDVLMMRWHLPFGVAAPLAAAMAVVIATVMHIVVERPSTRLAHVLRRRFGRMRSVRAPVSA